jgi:Family of unknown function (DUF6308)
MAIDIPDMLRDEVFATCLVKRYLAPDSATGCARYSGAYFERLGGGGDRPEVAYQFTAEDLLAVTMLSVRIEGYHALHVLDYQARELSGLLTQIPLGIALQDPRAEALIAEDGPAWELWRRSATSSRAPTTTASAPSRPASSWHASARTCSPSTTVASRRSSTGPAPTTHGGMTCGASSSTTRTSSASSSQYAPGQAPVTCPCSASST